MSVDTSELEGPTPTITWGPLPEEERRALAADVEAGLSAHPKTLPPKWFYDRRGSELFQRICALPEYYPTRTERAILEANAESIQTAIGAHPVIIELGAGDAAKTRVLLHRLPPWSTYVPVDISGPFLASVAAELRAELPDLRIEPVVADYHLALDLMDRFEPGRRTVLFIGSTIGNLEPSEALDLLQRISGRLVPGEHLLLGTDMRKSADVLVPAYDDAAGVTAAFNRNLLVRINRELDATFDVASFAHEARWNDAEGRMEMHLVSRFEQTVTVHAIERTFEFAAGESIHTENSHKYRRSEIEALASRAGLRRVDGWADAQGWFELHWLERTEA